MQCLKPEILCVKSCEILKNRVCVFRAIYSSLALSSRLNSHKANHGKIISKIIGIEIKVIVSRQFVFEISGTWFGGQTLEFTQS